MAEANITVHSSTEKYKTSLTNQKHIIVADEPLEKGGNDEGMNPYEILLSSLGACTSITMRMYANHKGYDLSNLKVELNLKQEEGKIIITRNIFLGTTFTDEISNRLLQVAKACPVSKILEGTIIIENKLTDSI